MQWQGKIDFAKPITLNGKPHGVEQLTSLPIWSISDEGRVVYSINTGKLWVGTSIGWDELTPGGIATHNHDDLYYTESETDDMFEGKNGEKQIINWVNVTNKPSTFTPEEHTHPNYLTPTQVDFSFMQAQSLVGSGINQLAQGNHTHTGFALDDHIHLELSQTTRTFYVDKNRTDEYAEVGSIVYPYKTIQAAIDKIIANNDDALDPYNIMIENGKYYETIVLESLNIRRLIITGQGTVQIRPTTGQSLRSVVNNTNIKMLHIRNITFLAPVEITGTAGSSAFEDVIWDDCNFVPGDGAQKGFLLLTCINGFTLRRAYASFAPIDTTGFTFTNVNYSFIDDCNIAATLNLIRDSNLPAPSWGIANGGYRIHNTIIHPTPTFSITGAASFYFRTISSIVGQPTSIVTIPLGVTLDAYNSFFRGSWTNNGTLSLMNSNIQTLLGNLPTIMQDASQIKNIPSGSVTAVNIQTAINQLSTTTVIPSIAEAPTDTPDIGTMRFDATTNTLYIYNGTTWKSTVLV